MTSRHLARLLAAPAAATVVVLSSASPASAHVSISASTTAAGAFTVLTVSVPHGCDGSPTTRVAIQVPDPILAVTPTRNPFWSVEARPVRLEEPVTDAHGSTVTERTGTIVYTARTPLPEGQRDTFQLSLRLPEQAGPLAFPTIQTCREGSTSWVETAQDGQDPDTLEHPAPAIVVTTAEEDADGHGDAVAYQAPALARVGLGAGLGAGLLGLGLGAAALVRVRRTP